MFLLDDRYMTLVAFIDGCNAATDRKLFDGFNEWVAARILGTESSLHWATIVAARSDPRLLEELRSVSIAPEIESKAADDLLRVFDREIVDARSPALGV